MNPLKYIKSRYYLICSTYYFQLFQNEYTTSFQ